MELGCIFRVLWSGMGTRGMSLGVYCDWCVIVAVGVKAQSQPFVSGDPFSHASEQGYIGAYGVIGSYICFESRLYSKYISFRLPIRRPLATWSDSAKLHGYSGVNSCFSLSIP